MKSLPQLTIRSIVIGIGGPPRLLLVAQCMLR